MKVVLPFVILVALCFACSESQNKIEQASKSEIEFKSILIDLKVSDYDLSELIDKVEFVGLEETPESLLTDVKQMSWSKGKMIFYDGDDIYFFSQSGKFLKKFNKAGKGPEEYSRITDLWLEGDTIAIYSRGSRFIKRYNQEGNFINSTKLDFFAGHIGRYKNGYVADMNFSPLQDTIMSNFVAFDKNFNPVSQFLPYKRPEVPVLPSINTVMPYKDGMTFFRMNSDTVYYFSENELKPLVHFDLGDDWFWKDRPDRKTEDFIAVENSDQVWEIAMSISDDFIYAKALIAYSQWEYFLINRNTQEVFRIDGMPKGAKESSDFVSLGWKDGRLLLAVVPSYAVDLEKMLKPEQVGYAEGTNLKALESSENPVLMWVKFK